MPYLIITRKLPTGHWQVFSTAFWEDIEIATARIKHVANIYPNNKFALLKITLPQPYDESKELIII